MATQNLAPLSSSSSYIPSASSAAPAPKDVTLVDALQKVITENGDMYQRSLRWAKTDDQRRRAEVYRKKQQQATELLTRLSNGNDPNQIQSEMGSLGLTPQGVGNIEPTTSGASQAITQIYGQDMGGLTKQDTSFAPVQKNIFRSIIDQASLSKGAAGRVAEARGPMQTAAALGQVAPDVILGQLANVMEVSARVPAFVTGTVAATAAPETFQQPRFWAPIGAPHSTALAQFKKPEENETSQLALDFLDIWNVAAGAGKALQGAARVAEMRKLQKASTLGKQGKFREAIELLRGKKADISTEKDIPKEGLKPSDMKTLLRHHAANKAETVINATTAMGGSGPELRVGIRKPSKPLEKASDIETAAIGTDESFQSLSNKMEGILSPSFKKDQRIPHIDPTNPDVQAMAFEYFAESPAAERSAQAAGTAGKTGRINASPMTRWTADNLQGLTSRDRNWRSQIAYDKARRKAGGKYLSQPGAVKMEDLMSGMEEAIDVSPSGAFKAATQKLTRGQTSLDAAQTAAARSAEEMQRRANESLQDYATRLGLKADELETILSRKSDELSTQKMIAAQAEARSSAAGANQMQNAQRNLDANEQLQLRLLKEEADGLLERAVSAKYMDPDNKAQYMSVFDDKDATPSDMLAMLELVRSEVSRAPLPGPSKSGMSPEEITNEARKNMEKRDRFLSTLSTGLLRKGRDVVRTINANYAHRNTLSFGKEKAEGTDLSTTRRNAQIEAAEQRKEGLRRNLERTTDKAFAALSKQVEPSEAGAAAAERTAQDYFANMSSSLESALKASVDDPSTGMSPDRAATAREVVKRLSKLSDRGMSLDELDGLASDLRGALTDGAGAIQVPRNEADKMLMRLYSSVNKLREESMREAIRLNNTRGGVVDEAASEKMFNEWKSAKDRRDDLLDTRYTLLRRYFPKGYHTTNRTADEATLYKTIGMDFNLALLPQSTGAEGAKDMVQLINNVMNDRAGMQPVKNFLSSMFDAAGRRVAAVKRDGGRQSFYDPDELGGGAPKRILPNERENLQTGTTPITRGDVSYPDDKMTNTLRQLSGPVLDGVILNLAGIDPFAGTIAHAYSTVINPRGRALFPMKGDLVTTGPTGRQKFSTKDAVHKAVRGALSNLLYYGGSVKSKPGRLMLGRLGVHAAAKSNENIYELLYNSPEVSDDAIRTAMLDMNEEQKRDLAQRLVLELMKGGYVGAVRELYNSAVSAAGKQEYQIEGSRAFPATERKDEFGNPIWNGNRGPMGLVEDVKNKAQELSAPVSEHWMGLSNKARSLAEFVAGSEGTGPDTSEQGKKYGTVAGVLQSTRDSYAKEFPEEKMWSLPPEEFSKLAQENPQAFHALVAERHMAEPGRWGITLNELAETSIPDYAKAAMVRLAGRGSQSDMRKIWSDALFRGSDLRATLWGNPSLPPELKQLYDDQGSAWVGTGKKPIMSVLEYLGSAPNGEELRKALAHDLTLAYARFAQEKDQESLESIKKFHSFLVGEGQ